MALSAKEFRVEERKKMRLRADIAARRNSLMTTGFPLAESNPNRQAQFVPTAPFDKPIIGGSAAVPGRAAADASIRQNQADVGQLAAFAPNLGRNLPQSQMLNRMNEKRMAHQVAYNNTMRPSRIRDENARRQQAASARGFSQGALDSLYEDAVAAPQATQPVGQRNYGPGLTPAAAEELYGPGGMYGTQPLQQGMTGPAPQKRIKSATDHLVDQIKTTKKRANIIRAAAGVFGGNRKAADRYEARRLAEINEYAGRYALSNLDDSDFQSKQKLFRALHKNGMPIDQILNVIQSGVADVPTTKLKDQQKQVFVDAEGDEHAGKIAWDGKGDLRYLKRDGTAAPDDWVPRQASSTNINLPGPEKPDPAIKKTMIKRAAAMMEEARTYWLDEDGKLHEELNMWDALGWRGPARTTKLKMARALSIALRLESGAAIGEDERAQFYDLFMPNAKDWLTGDREAVIADKFNDFQKYIEMIVDMIDPKWEDEDKREAFREVVEKAKDERERNIPLDMD
jgi:hypothetical protein